MNEQTVIEEFHQRAREWFKDHLATLSGDTIDWRRPSTSTYAIQYILKGGSVIVVGDVGDAIYRFGCKVDCEFLLQCDWHYFVHKCVASETGRLYVQKVEGIKRPVTNIRAIGHFVGLQMAIKQLRA